MSTKGTKSLSPEVASLVSLFQSTGLSEQMALKYAKDRKVAPAYKQLVERERLDERKLDAKAALLTVNVAESTLPDDKRSEVVKAIVDGRLKSGEQVSAALTFLGSNAYDEAAFGQAAGVGITISDQDISSIASSYLADHPPTSAEPWADNAKLFLSFKSLDSLRWADKARLKPNFDVAFLERFGPKPDPKARGKAESAATKAARAAATKPADTMRTDASTSTAPDMFSEGFLASLHRPGGNTQLSDKLKNEHLRATGSKVMTRFPPEPNGFLHIGHSRAIAVNFGYARHHNGHCYLRYDDTNPEAEEQVYFDAILEIVRWLGFEPFKITYSSDNFDRLYELAVELIKRDKAYMCFCSPETIKANRGQVTSNGSGAPTYGPRVACEHRSRPVEESLREFEKMRDGGYTSGSAVLRMKQDLEDGNPQMWDLIAYRTLNASHHRTGDKWKIYPTYDFTHCLCDSFENISHSLCTTEFIQSRVSYDWLCNALEVYRPQQREYGRLNIEGTVMSKRKILQLVREGHVSGWDDPRLYTLIALRRRGVPPGAIMALINELGVGESAADVSLKRFDQAVRAYAERTVPRLSLILRPLRLVIDNADELTFADPSDSSAPNAVPSYITRAVLPNSEDMGNVRQSFSREVYIDANDFRATPSADFQRLVPGGRIGLLGVPATFLCTSHTDTEVRCRYEPVPAGEKPRHKVKYIHWVDTKSAVEVEEVRLYDQLFTEAKPDFKRSDWISQLNPKSVEVLKGAVIESSFWEIATKAFDQAKAEAKRREGETKKELAETRDDAPQPAPAQLIGNEVVRFQALREAYYALDKDTELDLAAGRGKIILNRFVSLKSDAAKDA